jgi:parallel beta-helix repeat protein
MKGKAMLCRSNRQARKLSKIAGRRRSVPLSESLESRQFFAAHVVGDLAVYATIQAAVTAASPGATINVDAGTYAEMVTVNKPLTLRGAQAGNDARTRSGAETIVSGTALGGGVQSSAFYIQANDVTLDGFSVQGNTSPGTYGAGIVIAPGQFGTHVVNNIVQTNIAGLYLANASAVDQALIQHNLFRQNNNAGENSGRGIYSNGGIAGGSGLTNVLIDANSFVQNFGDPSTTELQAAIGLESQSLLQSNITISNNTMSGNGKGLLAWNVSGMTITNNTITGCQDAGSAALRFEGFANNVTIQGNTIANNLGAAIRIDNKAFAGTNSNFVITGNNLYANAAGGLVLGSGQYSGTLNATNNWWGSASGPSGDASGTGDALRANGNSVQFQPFATSPFGNPPAAIISAGSARSSLQTNFNAGSSSITGGNYLWFNSVMKPTFSSSGPATITFSASTVKLLLANGTSITATAPGAVIRFSPATTVATTSFDVASNMWLTNLPAKQLSGNVFLDGFAFRLPAGIGAHDLKGAIWNATFSSSDAGVSINWQYGVSVYNSHFLDNGYAGLGVKPVDDSQNSLYKNSHHAGTPESVLQDFLGNGGTGGGGSNFTGSYSPTASVKLRPPGTSSSSSS